MIAVLQPVQLFQILPCLRAAPVGDQQIEQPLVAVLILRMRGDKVEIKLDQLRVIGIIPVEIRAVFRVEHCMVRVAALRQQAQRPARQRRGVLAVFLRALVVQLGQQECRARLLLRLQTFFLQKAFFALKFLLRQEAAIPEHIVDALHAAVIRHGKQRVDGRPQRHRERRQQQNIRHTRSALPFGNSLRRNGQLLRQLLLRESRAGAQRPDLCAKFVCHVSHPFFRALVRSV